MTIEEKSEENTSRSSILTDNEKSLYKQGCIFGYHTRDMESRITEEDMIDAICDVLGLQEEEYLCLEDNLNYHVPILCVLEAMKLVLSQRNKND